MADIRNTSGFKLPQSVKRVMATCDSKVQRDEYRNVMVATERIYLHHKYQIKRRRDAETGAE